MPNFPPDYFPVGVNLRVPGMVYASDVAMEGIPYIQLGIGPNYTAPAAKSATFYCSATAMVNGSAVTVLASAMTNSVEPMRYGRGVQVVASAANARTATLTGFDYLGQPMVETMTINGTTPVNSLKAWKRLSQVVYSSAADTTTVNLGQSDVMGLPYRALKMITEYLNGASTSSGTFVAGLAIATTPTATNADVRGTYTPNSVPDGSRTYAISVELDRTQLHGVAQFTT